MQLTLLNTYCLPNIVLSLLQSLSQGSLTTTLVVSAAEPYFADEETESWIDDISLSFEVHIASALKPGLSHLSWGRSCLLLPFVLKSTAHGLRAFPILVTFFSLYRCLCAFENESELDIVEDLLKGWRGYFSTPEMQLVSSPAMSHRKSRAHLHLFF